MKNTKEPETKKQYADSYRLMIAGPDGNGIFLEGDAVITERPLEVCHFGEYDGKPTDIVRDEPKKVEASFRKSVLLVDGHSGLVAEMECYLQAASKESLPDAIITAKDSDFASEATSHGRVLKGFFTVKTRECTAADVAKIEAARNAANGDGELLSIAKDTNVTAHDTNVTAHVLADKKKKTSEARSAAAKRALREKREEDFYEKLNDAFLREVRKPKSDQNKWGHGGAWERVCHSPDFNITIPKDKAGRGRLCRRHKKGLARYLQKQGNRSE